MKLKYLEIVIPVSSARDEGHQACQQDHNVPRHSPLLRGALQRVMTKFFKVVRTLVGVRGGGLTLNKNFIQL
jgi:hypothetical protein